MRLTTLLSVAGSFWLLTLLPAGAQTPKLTIPPGGDPALACGQFPNGRTYWVEYGFCDVAVKGPEGARGLVIWSHGVSGDREQYVYPAPPLVRRLSRAGWDVIRINRNNLTERGWMVSGVRHRDDLMERVKAARAQGYKYVIAAGQSYGGAISLEAHAKGGGIDVVIALSPGHGSDARSLGGGSRYIELDADLLDALRRQRGGRVILSVPAKDDLHPNRRGPGSYIGPKAREVLTRTGLTFAVFDETMPIQGHGAATTAQFDAWFGDCIARLADPSVSAATGETRCPPPDPVPRFLMPVDLLRPARGAGERERWFGEWAGAYESSGLEVAVVIERATEGGFRIVYASGSGPERTLNMGWQRLEAKLEGGILRADRGGGRRIELRPDGSAGMTIHHITKKSTLTGTLRAAD
jgi:hypothetical protein